MTTPALVSVGRRVHSGSAGSGDLYDAGRTYTTISTATHANYSAIPSGQFVAVLTGANAGLWVGTGTTTITAVHDWSAVTEGAVLTADSWYIDEGGTSAGFTPPHTFQWASGAWALVTLPFWPSTLEIPADAAPTGVATGDRIMLILTSTVAGTNWQQTGGLDDWDPSPVINAEFPTGVYYTIRAYSRRWAPGCLPVTIETQDGSGSPFAPTGAIDFYTAEIAAFRPSYAVGPDHDGSVATSGASTLATSSVTIGAEAGILVAVGAQPLADSTQELGGFSTANGFTEVHRTDARNPEWPVWRSGDLAIATRDIDPSEFSTTVSGPIWSSPSTRVGVSLLFTLQNPDATGSGLSWNGLHFNGGGFR